MTSRLGLLAVLIVNATAGFCRAASTAEGPRVGDPAPPLASAAWLKGAPVPVWRPGSVYILDIWAPWCGPCLGGMQHLTNLQKTNASRGLVVVGLTGPDDYGTTLAAVKKVIELKGPAIGYSIAWDEHHRLYDVWMAREKNQGWPWSFVIGRDGRVAFIGHPEKLDGVLEAILAGTYDVDTGARRYRARSDAMDLVPQFNRASKEHRWRTADAIYRDVLAADREVAGVYAANEYKILAVNLRDDQRAAAFGRAAVQTYFSDRPQALAALASTIIDPDVALSKRDYPLARLCSEQADMLQRNAGSAAALARVYFSAGMPAEAVAAQQRALRLSDEADRPAARAALSKYLAGQAAASPR